jgi:hypothetical protein
MSSHTRRCVGRETVLPDLNYATMCVIQTIFKNILNSDYSRQVRRDLTSLDFRLAPSTRSASLDWYATCQLYR